MRILDMLGQPCPIPVIQAKKAMETTGTQQVTVLVDTIVAVQNLEKMAKGKGYRFSYNQEEADRYSVLLCGSDTALPEQPQPWVNQLQPLDHDSGLTVVITADHMGQGSEELGRILLKGFLFSLTQLPVPPKAVVFLNSGVKLTVEGANTITDLETLIDNGTIVRSCGTCLNYYTLTDKLAVGEVTDMFAITTLLHQSEKILTI